jgi:hypothetical protein
VIKRFVPAVVILAVACGGGGGDITPPPVVKLSDISSMSVGEVRVLNPTDIPNGIDLPAGSGARDYVIVVGNTSAQHDVVANYTVKADKGATGVFGIEAAANLMAQSSLQLNNVPLARTPQEAVENRVRAFERTKLTLRSGSTPFGAPRLSARRTALVSQLAVPVVGDVINIKIPNASTTDLCTNFIQTQAVVASVSQKAILMVDTLDGPPSSLFTQAQMDSITSEFDLLTYPTDVSYFNTPTDLDNNGGHIIILFTGQINKLTPPGSPASAGFVGGFFFAGDLFPVTDPGGPNGGPGSFCPESNRAEIFYLLSPDPGGLKFGNDRSASSVRQGTRGTIAHEFQHMINAGNRYISTDPRVTSFESTWLDEALSHFAEDAVGRVQRSFGDLQPLTFTDLVPCNAPCSQRDDFNAFFFQNLARLSYWMDKPDQFSPISNLADTSLAVRGAAWALVRYAADNYANGLPRTLMHQLSIGPDTGVKNFTAATKAPIDTLVKGWLVSMYADHLGITGLDAKYQYRSYNFRSAMPPVAKVVLSQSVATYPLRIQFVGSGSDNISAMNRSGTGSYFRLFVAAGAAAKNVKILDASGTTTASFTGEHIYVLRVQ